MKTTIHQESLHFREEVRQRLEGQGYVNVTPHWLDLAMFNKEWRPLIPRVVGMVLALYATDTPQCMYDSFGKWASSLLGRDGLGALIYVYNEPSVEDVEYVLSLGRGMLGYGQIVPYVYDLATREYWMWSPMQNMTHSTKSPF